MKDKQSRRDAIKTTAAVSIGLSCGAFAIPSGKRNLNISGKDFIREENSKKGTRELAVVEYQNRAGKDK
jgi:hypothetical protein